MSTQPHPDSVLELLRKIARLAADSSTTAGERAAATAKLRALMERHGLSEADLSDTEPRKFTLIPVPSTKQEMKLACQIIGMVRGLAIVPTGGVLGVSFWSEATPPEAADIVDCWRHYLPHLKDTAREIAAEQRRLRTQARKLGENYASAFCQKFGIYPQTDAPPRKWTQEEIARYVELAEMGDHVSGDQWTRKAGELGQLLLGC